MRLNPLVSYTQTVDLNIHSSPCLSSVLFHSDKNLECLHSSFGSERDVLSLALFQPLCPDYIHVRRLANETGAVGLGTDVCCFLAMDVSSTLWFWQVSFGSSSVSWWACLCLSCVIPPSCFPSWCHASFKPTCIICLGPRTKKKLTRKADLDGHLHPTIVSAGGDGTPHMNSELLSWLRKTVHHQSNTSRQDHLA